MNEIVLCFSNFCLFLLTLASPIILFSSLGAADFTYTKKKASGLEKLLCFNALNRPQMLIVELGLAYRKNSVITNSPGLVVQQFSVL